MEKLIAFESDGISSSWRGGNIRTAIYVCVRIVWVMKGNFRELVILARAESMWR